MGTGEMAGMAATPVLSVAGDGARAVRVAVEGVVESGGVVLFPADTVYGLGCDPLNAAAIGRIRALKGRDDGKPTAVMYFAPLAMRELIGGLGPRARAALAELLPGAVTLVLDNPARRYPLACASTPEKLGVRLIDGPLAGARIALFQTSANPAGQPPPVEFAAVDPAILAGVDLAVDGGPIGGEASTVVDISRLDSAGEWEILRTGAMDADRIGKALGYH